MNKKMKIPEFSMPSPITGQTQIEYLELRIRELEDHIMILTSKDNIPWNHDSNNMHESVGICEDLSDELGNILKVWINKYPNNPSRILANIEDAPITLREKMFMTALTIMNLPKAPVPSDPPKLSKEDMAMFMRMYMEQMKK